MKYSYFHWAFHPWAIYAVVGLAHRLFQLPQGTADADFQRLHAVARRHGARADRQGIDVLAIFATLFGTATSLGLGAQQINSGLNYLWQTGESNSIALIIIGVMTVLFILSAVSGVGKGIQFLSNVNMVIAVCCCCSWWRGPDHLHPQHLDRGAWRLSQRPGADVVPHRRLQRRQVARQLDDLLLGVVDPWAPFVGVFIARISKGRTIREFVVCVLLIPSGVTFLWFAVMGGAALHSELSGPGGIVEAVNNQGAAVSLFALLDQYPIAALTSLSPCSWWRSFSSRVPMPAPW